MAWIQTRPKKNGKKTFTVTIRLKGLPTQTATFDRLTDARNWSNSMESAFKEGRLSSSIEAKRHTLTEVIDRFLLDPSIKNKTKETYRPWLIWWKNEIGDLKLIDVTPSKISKHRDKLLKTPIEAKNSASEDKLRTPATCNRILAALSSVLSLASMEWQLIEENPCKNVRKLAEPRGRTRFLSDGERERLLKVCKESESKDLYLSVLISLNTGARKKEVWELNWNQVDLKNGVLIFNQTKNDEIRSVPLLGNVLNLLRDRNKVRRIDTSKVFPSKADPKNGILLERPWRTALKNAGIEDFRWHDLRHSAASYLAMSGVPMRSIAEILGHKTLQMVKRYSHLSQEHLREEMSKMSENFNLG